MPLRGILGESLAITPPRHFRPNISGGESLAGVSFGANLSVLAPKLRAGELTDKTGSGEA